ncbi:hypothetical protein X801_10048, partial [Opisthorchis viverrini]
MSSRTLRLPVITTIEYKGINLIIMDSPTKSSVPYFVEHWEFSDGSPPPDNVLSDWFNLLRARFYTEPKTASSNSTGAAGPVAVHCIAGYGRAPVLVAVALMELGMPCADAIELIR